MPYLTSWSFSKLMVFEDCPYRAKLQWLDKVPDTTPRPAADRGTQIHQEAEDYVTGKGHFTNNLRHFEKDLTALAAHHTAGRVICEEEWGFDRDWQVTDWKRAWLRLKCDVVCHLTPAHVAVVDYKTGKRFGNELKHAQQLQLYSLCSLIRYPKIQKTTNELWYLDQNELASFELSRAQLSRYLKLFDKRGRAMTEETKFLPKANIVSCKYCPYAPHKQGDCKYGINVEKIAEQQRAKEQPMNFVKPKKSKSDVLFGEDDLTRYM